MKIDTFGCSRSRNPLIAFLITVLIVASLFVFSRCDSDIEAKKYTIMSGGIKRSYELMVPSGYNGMAIPLVLDLHGSPSNGWQQALVISHIREVAEKNNFAVAHPNGQKGSWNSIEDPKKPNDIIFLTDVVKDIASKIAVDQNRIYAMGFSNGAQMASTLACRTDYIAAIAPVSGVRFSDNCVDRPIPVITFHGTGDKICPYEGEGDTDPEWTYGVDEAISRWVSHNNCDLAPETSNISEKVIKYAYSSPDEKDIIIFYKIINGGHTWPGNSIDIPFLGELNMDVNASEEAWKFFVQHPLIEPQIR